MNKNNIQSINVKYGNNNYYNIDNLRNSILLLFLLGFLVIIFKTKLSFCLLLRLIRFFIAIHITINLVDYWTGIKKKEERNIFMSFVFLLLFNLDYWLFSLQDLMLFFK